MTHLESHRASRILDRPKGTQCLVPTSAEQNLSTLRVTFIYLTHNSFVANLTFWFAQQEAFRSAAYPILRILVCDKLPPLNAPLLHTDSLQGWDLLSCSNKANGISLDFSLWWCYPAPSVFFSCFSFLGFRVLTSQGCCMDCLPPPCSFYGEGGN